MRRALPILCLFLGLFAQGCRQAADPCGSYSGTCLAVEVRADSSETVSELRVRIQLGAQMPVERTTVPPSGPTGFPLQFPLLLGGFGGMVQIEVGAPALGLRGQASATVTAGEHGRITVTLTAEPSPDLAAAADLPPAAMDMAPGPVAPPGRSFAAMAAHEDTGQLVLFGGIGERGVLLGDSWELGDKGWVEAQVAARPGARAGAAMAYDPVRRVVALFGGMGPSGSLNDLWFYDGKRWLQQTFGNAPPPRAFAAMTYTNAAGLLIMGGVRVENDSTLGDIWALRSDATSWTQYAAVLPAKLRSHALVAHNTIVYLLGSEEGLPALQLWSYELIGNRFVRLSPADAPAARRDMAVAWDPKSRSIIVHGGVSLDGTRFFDDTHLLSFALGTSSWARLTSVGGPSARLGAVAAWDANRGVVLFGGQAGGIMAGRTMLRDTWVLTSGRNWAELGK